MNSEIKKKRIYIPIKYFEINNEIISNIIPKYAKNEIPEYGEKRIYMWKGNDSWGLVFQIITKRKEEDKTNVTLKNLHFQLKWNGKGKIMLPTKGFEAFQRTIDIDDTLIIKNLLKQKSEEKAMLEDKTVDLNSDHSEVQKLD